MAGTNDDTMRDDNDNVIIPRECTLILMPECEWYWLNILDSFAPERMARVGVDMCYTVITSQKIISTYDLAFWKR